MTSRLYSPDYPGYQSVLERIPVEARQLEVQRPTRLELSRSGHAVLASTALVVLIVAPLVLPPAAALVGILVGEVSRAPWTEIIPAHPIGVGSGRDALTFGPSS